MGDFDGEQKELIKKLVNFCMIGSTCVAQPIRAVPLQLRGLSASISQCCYSYPFLPRTYCEELAKVPRLPESNQIRAGMDFQDLSEGIEKIKPPKM
jgi:hypothetical protein